MAGKKDKKAKAAEKKVRVAQKQEKKASKTEKKQKAKGKADDDSDAEDVDLDALLKEYEKKQEEFLKITETTCEPPSPRGSATFIGSPTKSHELLLFGGEYFNGALASFYNELFVYNTSRDEWRLVTSPNSPLPRSGHAWTRAGNTQEVYLFGGEFSSPKQGTFYHYNDFWKLDTTTREWSKVESKGKGPPARSGHRMTYYKNYIIVFGGFQDTSQQTKYLSDLWLYDCQTFTWHNPTLPPASPKPDARSSFSFLPHDSGAVLYGGYSRVKATMTTNAKKGASSSRVVLKPVIHQDTFFLRVIAPAADAPASTPPKVVWERRKRPANQPAPTRAGATMAFHKGRGIMFGGVHDVEESEEGIESEFFDQLFAWNIDRNRFFPLTVRKPRAAGRKAPAAAERSRRERGKADEEELLRNLAALEAKGGIAAPTGEESQQRAPDAAAEEEDSAVEKPVIFEMPHPRFNTLLTVQGDVLFMFGGTFEKGDREYTFDEVWAIDLGKLDGVREIFRRELEDWQGSDDEDEEGDDDEDGTEDGSSDDEDERSETATSEANLTPATTTSTSTGIGGQAGETDDVEQPEEEQSSLADTLPHPRPFESLRDFFDRTKVQWQELIMAEMSKATSTDARTIKEVRKDAFAQAEEKWWDCREEIRALEDEQEAAGIGEVVSLGDKGGAGSTAGPGRRR